MVRLLSAVVVLLAFSGSAVGQETTERWYENLDRNGQKTGYTRVTWAPSTWKGKRTVHDTTTVVSRTVRNMAGVMDEFESSFVLDLERGTDGTLWWMRSALTEGSRVSTDEITWNGAGYTQVKKIGDEPEQRVEFPMKTPVFIDAEAFLSERVRAGTVKVGDTFKCRLLDYRKRAARESDLTVEAAEQVPGVSGPVETLRVVETNPQSKTKMTYWLDAAGAFVRIRGDSGSATNQVPRKQAVEMPVEPPEFGVTTPSFPPLERVFSAKRLLLDWHLQGDENRSLPELPASPWTKVIRRRGSDEAGWVFELELTAHDNPAATGTLPFDGKAFEADLRSTPLMASDHPTLKAKAKEIVGDETSARAAAYKIARYVHGSLAKQSPDVGETTALEILRSGEGDCSEHCVLFVTLCRAAGIPARRASGYVNIGTMWGAHSWAEIWVGEWIGADATTGEVGTQARYVFFGYPDQPGSFPGVVTARSSGRMRFVATQLEEGDSTYDLSDPAALRVHEPGQGRYVHALAGIELDGVPPTWKVTLTGNGYARISAPNMQATLYANADQGYDLSRFGGANGTYAGAPARVMDAGDTLYVYAHTRRRIVTLSVQGGTPEQRTKLEHVVARTFAPALTAPEPAPPAEDDLPPIDEDGE